MLILILVKKVQKKPITKIPFSVLCLWFVSFVSYIKDTNKGFSTKVLFPSH